jgi:hypothetical protein
VQKLKPVIFILLAIMLIAQWILNERKISSTQQTESANNNVAESQVRAMRDNPELQTAFDNKKSNLWITGSGEIIKLLSDDDNGSRHQRFLVKVNPAQTILIAHNIDLADRVANLQLGDMIQFYGEYEWNEKGGVVHWTHHDPSAKKTGGWIKHNDITYQ